VCKRFRALCLAPQLLRSVKVLLGGNTMPPRLHAFIPFLATHGRQVHSLLVSCQVATAEQHEAALPLLCASLAACNGSAGSNFWELDVSYDAWLENTGWLAGMARLRRLDLAAFQGLELSASISCLHFLEEAELTGWPIDWSEVCRLPPSITHLCLMGQSLDEDVTEEQLPPQVS